MKTIIAGSRALKDYAAVVEAVRLSGFIITEVVSGKAPGADTLGERWASENGVAVKPFPADWDNLDAPGAVIRYQRSGKPYNALAGHDRNELMAAYADALIALPRIGKSSGTEDMIERARSHGLRIFVLPVNV